MKPKNSFADAGVKGYKSKTDKIIIVAIASVQFVLPII
jgi:hypothetical protein